MSTILISNTSVNCSTLNTHQRHRHLASIMPPPRGWREGRAPPSSRPGLEIEEFKEFMRMKLYYWLMLKRQFQPDTDQKYKICELRYFFWDASRNQKVWSDAQIKNVRGKGTSYDRSFLTLSRRAGGGRSRCIILELNWDPSRIFFISAGRAHRYTAVNEAEYRSQFFEGDDSDYDLLRYQPRLTGYDWERPIPPAFRASGEFRWKQGYFQ